MHRGLTIVRTTKFLGALFALSSMSACSDVADHRFQTTRLALTAGSGASSPDAGKTGTGGSSGTSSRLHPWAMTATAAITQPNHGEALYVGPPVTSAWYNPATYEIEVRGVVSGVPLEAFASGRLIVMVNGGIDVTGLQMQPQPLSQSLLFRARVLAGINPQWVERGVFVEVIDTEYGDEVLARDFISYFDLRMSSNATPTADNALRIDGMGAQLTDYGVGYLGVAPALSSLEVSHLQTLPHPGLTEFNADLAHRADALENFDSGDRDLKACIGLEEALELAPELTSLSEYSGLDGARTQAGTFYAIYEAMQENSAICSQVGSVLSFGSFGVSLLVSATCEMAKENWCVKEKPKVEDFEFCVNRMIGDPTSLSIESVSDVSLVFAETPVSEQDARLASHAQVLFARGRVNGHLRDLTIRWKNDKCTGRPSKDVAPETIVTTDWLSEFTTCRDIEVNADSASTLTTGNSALLAFNRAADREKLEVKQTRDGEFAFSEPPRLEPDKGVCAEEFLLEHAETLADSFYSRFEGVLNDTWNAGGERTQQAVALELLLSRFELGKSEFDDHGLEAKLDATRSSTLDGTSLLWRTLVTPKSSDAFARLRNGWFYHPAVDLPPHSSDANDPTGAKMDFSFTLTTGYLNQVLHALAAEHMFFELEPTWDELAALGVAGDHESPPPPLDGTVLKNLHPMFGELGSRTVEIRVSPTLDPQTWMNPDPPVDELTPHGTKLAYGIGGLVIRFAEPDTEDPVTRAVVAGKEWLRLWVGFYDDDFAFGFSPTNTEYLDARWVSPDWGVSVEYNAFSSCRPVPHGIYEPAMSCERELEKALMEFLAMRLEPLLLDMLSELPAPEHWDAAGEAARNPSKTRDTRRIQAGQNVTLYGNITDGTPPRR